MSDLYPKFVLGKSRYNLVIFCKIIFIIKIDLKKKTILLKDTFMGRFNQNMDIIDPRTLFVSNVRNLSF